MTLVLIGVLGAVFVKGLREAVSVAVVIVVIFLAVNLIVIVHGLTYIAAHPETLTAWRASLFAQQPNYALAVVAALLVFPRLALGLSGFETGVAVMPHVRGDGGRSDAARLASRIRNTKKLLFLAATIMSFMLIGSSIVTTLLIPAAAFQEGGEANGRALAYIAHRDLGDVFGTVYDLATITILWFAGASAMAGLLNLIPRYLPRYGMAPEWARASRPLVLIITAIAFIVTILFDADVEALGLTRRESWSLSRPSLSRRRSQHHDGGWRLAWCLPYSCIRLLPTSLNVPRASRSRYGSLPGWL